MRGAIYREFKGKISIENLPDPSPNDHGVILKVHATGLCLSDWHGWMGHDEDIVLPHVPGHEIAGEIVEIGKKVKGWKIGDIVTLPFVCGCGTCQTCQSEMPQVCPQQSQPGFTHWGSFAEYVSIQHAAFNLVRIPEWLELKYAASLGCRFATSYRAIVEQAKLREGQSIVVIGCGGVGLSAILISKAIGAEVTAVDVKPSALKKASSLGASSTFLVHRDTDLVAQIISNTNGGPHVTLDAYGSKEGLQLGVNLLREGGKHLQIGLLSPDQQNPPIPVSRLIAKELQIIGSHGMAAAQYTKMLSFIRSSGIDLSSLVEDTVQLDDVVDLLPVLHEYEKSGIRILQFE